MKVFLALVSREKKNIIWFRPTCFIPTDYKRQTIVVKSLSVVCFCDRKWYPIRTPFQEWQTQSGAGYVYIDCFGFLNLICPCLFLWPSTVACWKSDQMMLLFMKSCPNNAMFGLMVFKFSYVRCPTYKISRKSTRMIKINTSLAGNVCTESTGFA